MDFLHSTASQGFAGWLYVCVSLLATVLRRNPELSFETELLVDGLISDAYNLYLKDQGEETNTAGDPPVCPILGYRVLEQIQGDQFGEFYTQKQSLLDSYLARSIVNLLMSAENGQTRGMDCKVQWELEPGMKLRTLFY